MQQLRKVLKCAVATGMLAAGFAGPGAAAGDEAARAPLQANAARMQARIEAVSEFGLNANGGSDRVAFSEYDRAARELFAGLMRKAGLEVRVDSAGNLIGRRDGRCSVVVSALP